MRLLVDTSGVTFQVTRNPEPKKDQKGTQRVRKEDGAPMWTTQVMALDESGGEVINVTVAGQCPEVSVGQMVAPRQLEAIPWATNNGDSMRNGVAYRASELAPVGV